MEKDLLIILMIAFGLFAVIMFVLFYAYLKKYHNERHLSDDFEREIENKSDEDDEDIIGNVGIDDSKEEIYTPPVFEEHYDIEDKTNDENNLDNEGKQDIDNSEYALDDDSSDEGFIPVRKE